MPRMRLRDFSGGLVTNQSEFDLTEKQYVEFKNLVNKRPGRLERQKLETLVSATTSGDDVQTELVLYRTEKDSDNADISTAWWVLGNNTALERYTVSAGTGGSWTTITTDWTDDPIYDFLVHNQILRISDGSFTNTSKWYGHIKRDIFGKDLGLSAFVPYYLSPHNRMTINQWFIQDTAIPAPKIVKMTKAHDGGGSLSADSDVGIFVYEPRAKYDNDTIESDEHNAWVNALDNETFDPSDRWTVTYLYDHVQESELARDDDGNIGVSGFEVATGSDDEADSTALLNEALTETEADITLDTDNGALFQEYTYIKVDSEIMFIKSIATDVLHVRRGQLNTEPKEHADNADIYYRNSPQKGRAINIVLNGLTSDGYHNPRITGLNIYWQPKGDVDWYLVESLDINRGYADSILATTPDTLVPGSSNISPYYASNSFNADAMKNFGYWMPCPKSVATEDVIKHVDGSTTYFSFSATAWTGATNDFQNTNIGNIAILSRKETSDSDANNVTQFNRIGAYYTLVKDTGTNDEKVAFTSGNNINRVFAKHIAAYANVAKPNRITTYAEETSKVTTWYIPFDGLKLATYNSLTGRAAKTKLSNIKWNTSVVVNNRGYYADVDTVDENEQTAREKNRIYFTDPFQLDAILPGRYFDVGRNDGDEIIKLMSHRGKLFVFKSRNTYVYNIRHQMEKVFVGVGAVHKHAVFETPIGLVCANRQAVVAVTPTSVRELSFNIRDTYQGLTFEQTAVGYDGIDNELLVMHDSDATTIYVMNLDNGSWIERSITAKSNRSNFVISSGFRAQYLEVE